jgi:hypothetical protein
MESIVVSKLFGKIVQVKGDVVRPIWFDYIDPLHPYSLQELFRLMTKHTENMPTLSHFRTAFWLTNQSQYYYEKRGNEYVVFNMSRVNPSMIDTFFAMCDQIWTSVGEFKTVGQYVPQYNEIYLISDRVSRNRVFMNSMFLDSCNLNLQLDINRVAAENGFVTNVDVFEFNYDDSSVVVKSEEEQKMYQDSPDLDALTVIDQYEHAASLPIASECNVSKLIDAKCGDISYLEVQDSMEKRVMHMEEIYDSIEVPRAIPLTVIPSGLRYAARQGAARLDVTVKSTSIVVLNVVNRMVMVRSSSCGYDVPSLNYLGKCANPDQAVVTLLLSCGIQGKPMLITSVIEDDHETVVYHYSVKSQNPYSKVNYILSKRLVSLYCLGICFGFARQFVLKMGWIFRAGIITRSDEGKVVWDVPVSRPMFVGIPSHRVGDVMGEDEKVIGWHGGLKYFKYRKKKRRVVGECGVMARLMLSRDLTEEQRLSGVTRVLEKID